MALAPGLGPFRLMPLARPVTIGHGTNSEQCTDHEFGGNGKMPANGEFWDVYTNANQRGPAWPIRQPEANSQPHVVMAVIGLALVARVARDNRSYEHATMIAIGLAAAAGLGRASRARWFAHLAAWDKRRRVSEQRALQVNGA